MDIAEKIKDFTLKGIDKDGNEDEFSLSDFQGENVVLYFYPKDNTTGCTQEACDFRDNMNRITSKAVLIGISPDGVRSHKNFQTKHGLNYTLLSDPDHNVCEQFGVWQEKTMYGRKYMGVVRSTFLISKDGTLMKEWRKVKVKGHVDDVLEALETV